MTSNLAIAAQAVVDPEPVAPWNEMIATIQSVASSREIQDARRNEDAAMRKQYPGEYVAYLEADADARREVLARGRSLKAVHAALAHLPEAELNRITVTYCDSPAQATAFRGGYDRAKLPAPETVPDAVIAHCA